MKGSRRHFLLGSGTALALSSFPFALSAGQAVAGLPSGSSGVESVKGLVIYRQDLLPSRAYASVLAEAGMQSVGLSSDPVRQWRQSLAALVARAEGPVLGLTDWSDYQLLRGLGAELRRHARHEQRHTLRPGQAQEDAMALALIRLTASHTAAGGAPDSALTGSSLFSWELV